MGRRTCRCATGGRGFRLEQKRIFERFARITDGRRRSDGAGLGLAVVAGIASAHGGTAKAESRPGGASTFTIIVPTAGPESN